MILSTPPLGNGYCCKIIDPEDFITQTFPLEEIGTYFNRQREDISDVIKMVMVKK